ncbi:hypothetical protein CMV_015860 [Castanea mollissima]|uniref:Aminotransferase-like plant mobile domain-containing protein n=1 Tax=Castanea mollissima TaxID=60419 RepID=A0A8J4R904_9ROSI|nr:hypothetical protein CMV_015860 [Castanea mollissima]
MAEPIYAIFEEREELMVSPTGGNPTLRLAHFLKPSVSSIDELPPPFLSAEPTVSELEKLPLKVHFKGWRRTDENWKMWVASLHSKYQSIWKESGIYEAIMCSKYSICRHQDLILGLAEKWCPKTNTFIFSWGEATVTLEDMMALGGYSVLGESVLSPLVTKEMEEIHEILLEANRRVSLSFTASQHKWLEHFMGSGSKIEHEAFLSYWLSKFVFPLCEYRIERQNFPIAILMARGTRIALAPAVLSSIYTDLGLLKEKLVASTKLDTEEVLNLSAPFQLVQLWAWERFPALRPSPISISQCEPRPARWSKLKKVSIENVRLAIDTAEESFQWRPYAIAANHNWLFPKFYEEKEQWVSVDAALDKELESFALCLRVCELLGLHCIQQYLPHRVAMQFGIDQDLPGHVARYNMSQGIAWSHYNRSIGDSKLYIPPRLFEADVTMRYFEWWKQSMSAQKDAIKNFVTRPRDSRRIPRVYSGKMENYNVFVPPSSFVECFKMDTVKETKLLGTLSEKRLAIDVKPLPVSVSQKMSHSTADDGVPEKDLLMILEAKDIQSEGLMGEAKKILTDVTVREVEHPKNIVVHVKENDGKSSSYCKTEMPGLELEARISRLERAVAELKAARANN